MSTIYYKLALKIDYHNVTAILTRIKKPGFTANLAIDLFTNSNYKYTAMGNRKGWPIRMRHL
jgi:hypothetical protein